jgi:phosphoglycolate phosphatase-like HAD superfamily hydrolase
LAEQLGTFPGTTLVVGDGRQDTLAARAVGMPFCALFQGYTARDALLDARPDHVLEVIADLPRLVP